jgi:hypothetical protein
LSSHTIQPFTREEYREGKEKRQGDREKKRYSGTELFLGRGVLLRVVPSF